MGVGYEFKCKKCGRECWANPGIGTMCSFLEDRL